jgi:hypothetical protein
MQYCVLVLLFLLFPHLVHATEPVDTLQFGLIRIGMSEAEVVKRLGKPVQILRKPSPAVKVYTPHDPVVRKKRQYTYVYPGTSQIMDTYITFEKGVVVDKVKRR